MPSSNCKSPSCQSNCCNTYNECPDLYKNISHIDKTYTQCKQSTSSSSSSSLSPGAIIGIFVGSFFAFFFIIFAICIILRYYKNKPQPVPGLVDLNAQNNGVNAQPQVYGQPTNGQPIQNQQIYGQPYQQNFNGNAPYIYQPAYNFQQSSFNKNGQRMSQQQFMRKQ